MSTKELVVNDLVFDQLILLVEDEARYKDYSIAEIVKMCVGGMVLPNNTYKQLVEKATECVVINHPQTMMELLEIICCLEGTIENKTGSFYSISLKPTMFWTFDNCCIVKMVYRF